MLIHLTPREFWVTCHWGTLYALQPSASEMWMRRN